MPVLGQRISLAWNGLVGAASGLRKYGRGDPAPTISVSGDLPRQGTLAPPATVTESVDSAAEDRGFRLLVAAHTDRDVPPGEWRALLEEAYLAYCTNPLAYAIVEMGVNFILRGGVRLVAADPRVQTALDAFWDDPENHMGTRVYSIATELSLYGEQFLRFFVDPLTGRTVIRQIDPLLVDEIETDPHDIERILRYRIRSPAFTRPGDEEHWIDAAEVEAFQINKVSNAVRGRSDLAPLLPWLRRYKEWLTDRVRINRYKSAFLYDVTLLGATPATIQAKRAEYAAPPEPGTVIFHNESEQWKAVQPQIGADDVAADGRALKLMIAAGAGIPEHYLGEGGHVNRATAAEMGLPTMKRFQRRQEYFRELLKRVAARVIDARVQAGRLGRRIDRAVRVEFEELHEQDRAALGRTIAPFAQALALATSSGWLDPAEARSLFWRFLGEEPGPDV
jgi:hypothetical protein